jgi:hypothetical protein
VMWTGLVWLRIGTGGELLWSRYWTFRFHNMLGHHPMAQYLVASRVVLSSIELVSLRSDPECVLTHKSAYSITLKERVIQKHCKEKKNCSLSQEYSSLGETWLNLWGQEINWVPLVLLRLPTGQTHLLQ